MSKSDFLSFGLKVFFPSWRFFEKAGQCPRLFYRIEEEGVCGPWVSCPSEPRRTIISVFYNPLGNLYLASTTLIDQLINEINETQPDSFEDLVNSVPFKLVNDLVRFSMNEDRKIVALNSRFQFQILLGDEEVVVSLFQAAAE